MKRGFSTKIVAAVLSAKARVFNTAFDAKPLTLTTSRRCYFRSTVASDAVITVSAGGEYSLDGGAWTSGAGVRGTAKYIQCRGTSSAAYEDPLTFTVTIAGTPFAFVVVTRAAGSTTLETFMLDISEGSKLYYAPDLSNNKIPNSLTAPVTDDNLMPLCSGDFYGNYGGIVPYAATGPGGQTTAGSWTIAAGATKYILPAQYLPSGTFTAAFKIKNSVSGSIDVKVTVFFETPQVLTISDIGWTTFTQTFVSDGVNVKSISLKNESVSSYTILIDEVQLYSGSSVPEFSTVFSDSLTPLFPGRTQLTLAGGALDLSTTSIQSTIRLDSFPLKTSITACTIFAVVSDGNVTQTRTAIITAATNDTTLALDLSKGTTYGAPVITHLKALNYIFGKGYHVVAVRFNTSEQSAFIDNIKCEQTTVKSAVSIAFFQLFGYNTHPDNNAKLKTTIIGYIPSSITDEQIATIVPLIKAKHIASGESAITPITNYWIAEGDSITAGDVGTNVVSYPMQYLRTSVDCYGNLPAISGSTLVTMNTRLSSVLETIASVKQETGRQCIVSTLIGANAIPTIGDMITYWTALRAAGAVVVACTVLPIDGNSTFETNRLAWNTAIRGASAYYDALADFGDTSTEIGKYTSRADHPTWWYDTTHLTTLGHTELYNIIKPVIDNLLL